MTITLNYKCDDCDEYIFDFRDAVLHTISARHNIVVEVDEESLRSYMVRHGVFEPAAEDE